MSFFDDSVPPIRRKPTNLKLAPHEKLWDVTYSMGKHQFYSTFYTRPDGACLFWALLLIPIFVIPQFFSVSWRPMAVLSSGSGLVGLAMMVYFAHIWVKLQRVIWVLYCWVILIVMGLVLTDLAIFLGWGGVLINLCSLWLGLCAIGYWCTGLAVHSRAIIGVGFVHLFAIGILPYVGGWLFLFTGTVMVLSLLILAEFRWDMISASVEK